MLYSPQTIHSTSLSAILKAGQLKAKHLLYSLSEASIAQKKPATPCFKEINPRATRILNLNQSQEELLKAMHPKGRYNIKVAKKNQITVKKSQDLKTFYQLWQQTSQRDEFAIHSLKYLEKVFKNLQNATLYLAYHEKKPIAGLIALDGKNTRFYLYGASDHKFRKLMAPYALQWEAILDAKHNQLEFYDFLGVQNPLDKSNKLQGVSEFKRKFGGDIIYFQKGQIKIYNWPIFILMKIRKLLKNLKFF